MITYPTNHIHFQFVNHINLTLKSISFSHQSSSFKSLNLHVTFLSTFSLSMALIITCSALPTIRASSGSGSLNPDQNRKKSAAWWAPLFGLPSDPDYLNIESSCSTVNPDKTDISGSGQKFRRGCFTEEKAKQLRRKTAEASTFHDVMYHSAIASRLASDITGRVED